MLLIVEIHLQIKLSKGRHVYGSIVSSSTTFDILRAQFQQYWKQFGNEQDQVLFLIDHVDHNLGRWFLRPLSSGKKTDLCDLYGQQ